MNLKGYSMSKIRVVEQDIVFLSYDEPNAEKNYTDLCQKIPWAKRVHGVKGSDAAHKACADLSDTEHFITVDGDNIVNPEFLNVEIDLEELGVTPNHVFSWCGKVHVNGLKYGNGGLKLWTKDFVKNMQTHENAKDNDPRSLIEFCYDTNYYHLNENYSTSYTNASAFQAWRAGFREGVKMSLNQGEKVTNINSIWWQNLERLKIWCSVGADVENGLWSLYGAREGCYMTNCTDWDYVQVRDFEYLTEYWNKNYSNYAGNDLVSKIESLGESLANELALDVALLDKTGSKFFKQVYHNSTRILKNRKS